MAEKETKKANFSMSIWFIIFLVYLIFSLACILSQNSTIKSLNSQIATLENQLEETISSSNERSKNILDELTAIVNKYTTPEVETPSTLLGTYTGSAVATEGEETLTLAMTLTLLENNVATLSVTNNSGDSLLNGAYDVVDGLLHFRADDDSVAYSFTVVNESTLKLVDTELTLVK